MDPALEVLDLSCILCARIAKVPQDIDVHVIMQDVDNGVMMECIGQFHFGPGLPPQETLVGLFLKKINRKPTDANFWHIDKIFVPPREYDAIKQALATKRIVIITGTPEYGKTYVAVRLLWEYFSRSDGTRGYNPVMYSGGDTSLNSARELAELESTPLPRTIAYFEDPFGTIVYQDNLFISQLTRRMDMIIDWIQKTQDTYVIITSREEMFKQFKYNCTENAIELFDQQIEQQLCIKQDSYDVESRKHMLLEWAKVFGCKWTKDPALANVVAGWLDIKENLPTPLNIKDYALKTTHLSDEGQLRDEMKSMSRKTPEIFASEIINMSPDKQLFLSILSLIRRPANYEYFSNLYHQALRDVEVIAVIGDAGVAKYYSTDQILEWFKNDKIKIMRYIEGDDEIVQLDFAHPSYDQAIDYLINKGGPSNAIETKRFAEVYSRVTALVTANLGIESIDKVRIPMGPTRLTPMARPAPIAIPPHVLLAVRDLMKGSQIYTGHARRSPSLEYLRRFFVDTARPFKEGLDDHIWKIVVGGPPGSGKEAILKRNIHNEYIDDMRMTVGAQFHTQLLERAGRKISLVLWDLSGQDRFRFIHGDYVKGAAGCIVCFDMSLRAMLGDAWRWIRLFKDNAQHAPILLVGTKLDLVTDLEELKAVEEEAKQLVEEHGLIGFVPVSQKSHINVDEAIYFLVDTLLHYASMARELDRHNDRDTMPTTSIKRKKAS
ncbi:MAG: GTP-binding protein [Candidatus Lokiarchaeota archaeon]|nr:GTP-binding protein [Candidatus Lokiarchaeota archaeon]